MTAQAVGTAISIGFGKRIRNACLPGRGVGWNWKQCRPCLSLGCSVRPFAGANCPHRTPLNCVVFDCGECGWGISLVQITSPFSGLGGFLHDDLGMLMVLMEFIGKHHTFSAHHGCRSAPLSVPFRPSWPLR